MKADGFSCVYGKDYAARRRPACSTFKWPLALMAFDSGVLGNGNAPFIWDGRRHAAESWNRDQTAESWMKNSVVWCSQQLARALGAEKVQSYLDAFDYGSRDISSGIETAWLTATKTSGNDARGSLAISPLEQVDFVKKFWRGDLPVSAAALEKTRGLVFLEESSRGFSLHGKTGSGYTDGLEGDFGWFIGHVGGEGVACVVVTAFTREGNMADKRYPGLVARELTRDILASNGLW